MPKPKSTTSITFVCHGRLHRNTNAPAVLANRRVSAGILCDATLDQLDAYHAGQALNSNQAQKLTTIVANQLGIQGGPLNHRARIAIVGNAVNAWNNHLNHDAGLPKKYAGQPVNTIETFANGDRLRKPLVIFNRSDNATLRFPGLPPIRLISCRPLPDDQPTYCSVSVHEKQVKVSLTYRIPQEPLPPEGQWNPHDVLGVDVGITDLTATSAGISYAGIKQRQLQAKIKQAIRMRQAMVRKAMHARLAGYRPVLDENNRQIKTDKGTPRRYRHWIKGKPTKEYRKANQCVSRLLRQRMRQRRAYRHQVAASIVKHCIAHGIQLISMEQLPILNLTKSGRGTIENPGKRVAQKRGLNRRILEQGWAELTEFIKYKARYHGIRLVQVYASGTSQTCSACRNRDAKSRKDKRFSCTGCHYQADADHNAALNIGDRGTYIYVKRQGVTLADIRQQRLMLQDVSEPTRQEPATGLGPTPPAYPTG